MRTLIPFVWALVFTGCGGPGDVSELELELIPGSLTRVESAISAPTPIQLDLMATQEDCQRLINEGVLEKMSECLPQVDAGNGNVRLAYRILDNGSPLALPMQVDPVTNQVSPHRYMSVMHQTEGVRDGWADDSDNAVTRHVSITPHGESLEAAQLFVLLIDRSDSMRKNDGGKTTRMGRLKEALSSRAVTDRFFSNDQNRVLVLSFAQDVREVGGRGGSYQLIADPDAYYDVIQGLRANGSWTHLYDAVQFATTVALERPEVQKYLLDQKALPTVIALTDGFDNQNNAETCGDNASALSSLLKKIKKKRSAKEEVLAPVIYTVGLGAPALPDFPFVSEGKEGEERRKAAAAKMFKPPTPEGLCGSAAGRVIDPRGSLPGLEDDGIDNASLEWIAFRGGGKSVVTTELSDLIAAFEQAAAKRYEWFELRYHTDPAYFRQSFRVRLKTEAFVSTSAEIRFHPPTAFSLPEPTVSESGWWAPSAPFRSTTSLVLSILGFCVSLAFLGAATFNLRRALTREQIRSSSPK
jgi:hypothetical protein